MHDEDYSGEGEEREGGVFSLNLTARLWRACLDFRGTCNGEAVTCVPVKAARLVAHPGEFIPQPRVLGQECRLRRHVPVSALRFLPAPGLRANVASSLHFFAQCQTVRSSASYVLPVRLRPLGVVCAFPCHRGLMLRQLSVPLPPRVYLHGGSVAG